MSGGAGERLDLKPWHVDLLRVLDEIGGQTAAQAGVLARIGTDARTAASTTTPNLKHLEAIGLVRRLDDERPIAWLRTPAGTEWLARQPTPAAPGRVG